MLTHADVATSTQPMSYDSNYSRSELWKATLSGRGLDTGVVQKWH